MADPTQVAEQKANAKSTADAVVATDPQAIHAVQSIGTSKKTMGSAAVGAAAGFMLGGPPGALIGAGVGWVAEKYRIAGGPVGKAWDWIQSKRAAAVQQSTPPAPPPAGQ